MESSNLRLSVLFVGDSGVGKTSIKNRLMGINGVDVKSTIGVEFSSFSLNVGRFNLKFVILDIGGQKHYSYIRTTYYKNPDLVVAVFDVSNDNSIVNLASWIKEVKDIVGSVEIPVLIVGNKIDLRREPNKGLLDFTKEKIAEMGLRVVGDIYVSAKEGTNIDELYSVIVRESVKSFVNKKRSEKMVRY